MPKSKRLVHTPLLEPQFDVQLLPNTKKQESQEKQTKQKQKLAWTDFNARLIYFNRAFDKSRLKGLVKWTLAYFGEKKTIDVVETLKSVGYTSATQAGLSLSIDDLLVPPSKIPLMIQTETKLEHTQRRVSKGFLTSIEYLSQVIATWNVTNDMIKNQVIDHFRSQDILNPVYMMAFSGARGNISQVRQLVGMRGLMSDPSGRIIDYAIQSNFREGLTLTEYVISCYGARKGVVDTALRTATSGYLTRRLVDVAQHVIVRRFDCGTKKGIFLTSLENEEKTFMSGSSRLVGRVLAQDVYDSNLVKLLAKRNQEVTPPLAKILFKHHSKILVRSALTCEDRTFVCQLCYGWDLSKGRLVSLGETVGIIAAQSIGEPGTQLTMRTFHTGGVFSGEISKTFQSPIYGRVSFLNSIAGKCVRTDQGEMAFLTKQSGVLYIKPLEKSKTTRISKIVLKPYTLLFVKQGEIVYPDQVLAEPSSLDRLSQRNQSFQTIFSPISGEVKFRTTHLTKGAHNPDFTTFVPLSQYSSEFWILSSQTQRFRNPFKTFVQPGDQVELKSPIFTSILLSKTDPLYCDSFVFQSYISFYRTQTLFSTLSQIKFSQTPDCGQLYVANVNTQPTFYLSTPLMKRGTFMERLLPFVAFFPKRRFLFGWNKLEKKRVDHNQERQGKKFKKKNSIPKTLKFKRSLNLYNQLCKNPVSIPYPFTFNQKERFTSTSQQKIKKTKKLKSFKFKDQPMMQLTKFYSMFECTRKNDNPQFSFFLSLLTKFEQQLFLSQSTPLSYSDTLFFKQYRKRFCLKYPEQIGDSYLGKNVPANSKSFYSPFDGLWLIAYLKKPTPDFQKPFYDIFPKKLAFNLNNSLQSWKNLSLTINPPLSFCFYYRLVTHFRFQKFYEVQLSKLLRREPTFSPISVLRHRFAFDSIESIWKWVPEERVTIPFFPKSLFFFDRIQQSIYLKAFLLLLKQKEKNQYQPFLQCSKNNGNLNSSQFHKEFDYLHLKKNVLSNPTFPRDEYFKSQSHHFQLRGLKKYTKIGSSFWNDETRPEIKDIKTIRLLRHLNKIFAFHEFNQFPFCFDIFSIQGKQNLLKSNKVALNRSQNTLQIYPNQQIVSSNLFQISPIHSFDRLKQITKKNTITNGFSQKTILLQLLKNKTSFIKNRSKQFVSLLHLLIICVHKIFFWKQAFKKLNQLLIFYQLKKFYTKQEDSESSQLLQTDHLEKPMVSMYIFLKKISYKKATLRSARVNFSNEFNSLALDRSMTKRAWLPINKRRQTAIARLQIVYCLTQFLSPLLLTSFSSFTRRLPNIKSFPTTQKNTDSFFSLWWAHNVSCFKTRYYEDWSSSAKEQIQTQFYHDCLFQEWNKNLNQLWQSNPMDFEKKNKSKSMIYSFVQLWFYNRKKKLSRPFTIPTIKHFFGPYKSVVLNQPNPALSIAVFLQKSYEKQVLVKFEHSYSKNTIYYTSLFLNQTNVSNSLQISELNQPWERENHTIIYFLKQMKKSFLQKDAEQVYQEPKKAQKFNQQKLRKRTISELATPLFRGNYSSTQFEFAMRSPNLYQNERRYFNPFGWASFICCSHKQLGSDLDNLLNQRFNKLSTRETLFAFSHNKFQPVYDPWWRHKIHQISILSILKTPKKHRVKKFSFPSFGQFLKNPNNFFYSYLEQNFFNQIATQTKANYLCKKMFIASISFYTQPIKLKVKNVHPPLNLFSLNINTLNVYVRLVFLKTAKLPLIFTTKNFMEPRLQKRLITIDFKNIYISKNTRYRPVFIFDGLKYSKNGTSTEMKIQFLSKPEYVLSILQKGTLYRTGSEMMKTFVQKKIDNLNNVCFSGAIKKEIPNSKSSQSSQKQRSMPSLNKLSTQFNSMQLNQFQLILRHHYFNPVLSEFQSYQQLNSLSYFYMSHQFGDVGQISSHSCGFIQTRRFHSYQNLMAKLSLKENKELMLANKEKIQIEKSPIMTEVSPITGMVLQRFDLTNKAKKVQDYEHDMPKFRYQSEPLCSISYLTNTDMLTYRLSPPLQKLGSFISYGEKLIPIQETTHDFYSRSKNNDQSIPYDTNSSGFLLNEPGQIIYLTKTKIVVRRAQCFLLAAGSECNLKHGDLVSFGAPLVTVAYSQIQTDDIIQGIPKIDQFFEARTRINSVSLKQMLAKKYAFLRKEKKQTKRDMVLESLDYIQKLIVDGIQTVYQSQGVTISDKHVEIIVRQMTSKVRIRTALGTGFLDGDVVSFHLIDVGGFFDKKDLAFECEPVLLGITQTALQAEGFLSAASFQETIRILSQAAVVRKVDYIKNLKENIIIGHLLPSGTGLRKLVKTSKTQTLSPELLELKQK